MMPTASKTCPICQMVNVATAETCRQCGSDLRGLPAVTVDPEAAPPRYAFERGETDLLEEGVAGQPLVRLLGGLIILLALALVALVLMGAFAAISSRGGGEAALPIATAESQTVLFLATVTPSRSTATHTPWPSATPLPTLTPTPAPCIQEVRPGDTLIALVTRCGHRHRDILTLVVEQNGLADAQQIQIGQEIIIPWPTATPQQGEGEAAAENTPVSVLLAATSTLPAGVMWHRVSLGEDIAYIASQYGANLEIMSQLNPEVSFPQCDFGLVYGGDNCIVLVVEGQQLRVPAPTPLPSATPAPVFAQGTAASGPQENIPFSLRPGDGMVYRNDEIVTLRWLSSGTLAANEVYIVEVIDETASRRYLAETRDVLLRLPAHWQGGDGQRHEYRWRVGLRSGENEGETIWTEARNFIWLARGRQT